MDPARFGVPYPLADRRHDLGALEALQQSLVARRVLHHGLGLAVHGEHQRVA